MSTTGYPALPRKSQRQRFVESVFDQIAPRDPAEGNRFPESTAAPLERFDRWMEGAPPPTASAPAASAAMPSKRPTVDRGPMLDAPDFSGVTGGGRSSTEPHLFAAEEGGKEGPNQSDAQLAGFSFKDPGHVVDDAERRGSAFGSSPSYFREAPVQFAEDDARRPQQVAQQAYELQQKGLREHDEDRARSLEIAALKQQAEQQRAAAIMQFEQTYGVPYSDASAPHIIQAAYEQQKDSDYEKQAAQYAQYLGMGSMPGPDGRVRPFTRADYDAAMLALQFKMGVDKKAPGEFFRSLTDPFAASPR